jgi:membrane protease YdiL (CAAX protease family)
MTAGRRNRWRERIASAQQGGPPPPLPARVHPADAEPATVRARRRRVVTATGIGGAGLLGISLSTKPGSPQFYVLTMGVAGTWAAGALGSGPLHLGSIQGRGNDKRRPLVAPVLTGIGAFGLFYGAARLARHIPPLDRAIGGVLRYADEGSTRLVLLTACTNGVAEELFFRGALWPVMEESHPIVKTTLAYAAMTAPTRNPALVLGGTVMSVLFGLQRRASGGILAPGAHPCHVVGPHAVLSAAPVPDAPAAGGSSQLTQATGPGDRPARRSPAPALPSAPGAGFPGLGWSGLLMTIILARPGSLFRASAIMPSPADGAVSGVPPRRSRPRCRTPGVCPGRRSGSAVVPGSWRRPPWLAGLPRWQCQLSRSGRRALDRGRGRQQTRARRYVRSRLRPPGVGVAGRWLGLASRRWSPLPPLGTYNGRRELIEHPQAPGRFPGRPGDPPRMTAVRDAAADESCGGVAAADLLQRSDHGPRTAGRSLRCRGGARRRTTWCPARRSVRWPRPW